MRRFQCIGEHATELFTIPRIGGSRISTICLSSQVGIGSRLQALDGDWMMMLCRATSVTGSKQSRMSVQGFSAHTGLGDGFMFLWIFSTFFL